MNLNDSGISEGSFKEQNYDIVAWCCEKAMLEEADSAT